jgi:hypothetical protein
MRARLLPALVGEYRENKNVVARFCTVNPTVSPYVLIGYLHDIMGHQQCSQQRDFASINLKNGQTQFRLGAICASSG